MQSSVRRGPTGIANKPRWLPLLAALCTTGTSLTLQAADERDLAFRDDVAEAQQDFEQRSRACLTFTGQARSSCHAEAQARRANVVSLARARHGGTPQAAYRASLADAEAAFRAATTQCELLEGVERRGCVGEAREQRQRARVEAREALDAFTDRRTARSQLSSSTHWTPCGEAASPGCRGDMRATSGP